VGASVASDTSVGMVLLVCALVLTVIQTFLLLRRLQGNVLSQFRVEIGLIALSTIAMLASIFVTPASTIEKRLVLLSLFSAALLFATAAVHVPMVLLRIRRGARRGATQA
jgi:hypothetical protein